MRFSRLGALIAAAVALAPVLGHSDPAGLTFVERTVAQNWDQNDTLLAVGSGTSPLIYYATPVEHVIWRSANGGATWTAKATPPSVSGSGSSTGNTGLAIDAAGSVYISNPQGGHYQDVVYTSFDQGDSWAGDYPNRSRQCDYAERMWTVAGAAGRVFHVTPCMTGDAARFPEQDVYGWISTNSGAAGSYAQTILAQDVEVVGPAVFDGSSKIYNVYQDSDGNVAVAAGANNGASWANSTVANVDDLQGFPVVATDDSGNVYVAWAEIASTPTPLGNVSPLEVAKVMLSRSSDGGATWTAPIVVSDPAAGSTKPWISAGASGRIAIAYFTAGNVVVAESLNATAGSPLFTLDTVASDVDPGKFFQTDIDDAGNLYVTYARDPGPLSACSLAPFVGCGLSSFDLMLAVQTGGQKLR